jgi:hypothetical protein
MYYEETFLNFIETHKAVLKAKSIQISVYMNTELSTYIYEGDAIGLMEHLKVSTWLIPIVMMVNDIHTYNSDLSGLKVLYIPPTSDIGRLVSYYNTMYPGN